MSTKPRYSPNRIFVVYTFSTWQSSTIQLVIPSADALFLHGEVVDDITHSTFAVIVFGEATFLYGKTGTDSVHAQSPITAFGAEGCSFNSHARFAGYF